MPPSTARERTTSRLGAVRGQKVFFKAHGQLLAAKAGPRRAGAATLRALRRAMHLPPTLRHDEVRRERVQASIDRHCGGTARRRISHPLSRSRSGMLEPRPDGGLGTLGSAETWPDIVLVAARGAATIRRRAESGRRERWRRPLQSERARPRANSRGGPTNEPCAG